MDYSAYGFIGFALLFGMLFCIFSSKNIEQKEFKHSLDQEQLNIYKQIVEFRFNIWLQGMLLGLIVAVGVCYYLQENFNTFGNALLFTAILLFTNYMFYMLYPKPAWMLDFTRNHQQVQEWVDLYKTMSGRYHWGMLFGVGAFYLLSLAFFDYKLHKVSLEIPILS